MGGGQLGGLQRELRGRTTNDNRQVIRRAGRRPQAFDLPPQEVQHPLLIQERFGLLVEEGLIGTPTTLGHEEELVLRSFTQRNLYLGRQIGSRIDLVPHGDRRHLGVPQIELLESVKDAVRKVLGVLAVSDHPVTPLGRNDRRAGVLAHGQNTPGGHVGVLQQVQGHVAVIG